MTSDSPQTAYESQLENCIVPSARANTAVTVVAGATYTFRAEDFDLIGALGSNLTEVQITGLERRGTLEYSGAPVMLNAVVTRVDLDAGKLQYVPDQDATGADYDSFLFTTREGSTWSKSPTFMTLHAESKTGQTIRAFKSAAEHFGALAEEGLLDEGTSKLLDELDADTLDDAELEEALGNLESLDLDSLDLDEGMQTDEAVANGTLEYHSDTEADATTEAEVAEIDVAETEADVTEAYDAQTEDTGVGEAEVDDLDEAASDEDVYALSSDQSLDLEEYESVLDAGATEDETTESSHPLASLFDGTIPPLITTEESDHDSKPMAGDGSICIENADSYKFKPSDFKFSDGDGVMTQIKVVEVATQGSLHLRGLVVSAFQIVPVADLLAGELVFFPDGPGTATFEFKVHDGDAWSEESYTMRVEVADAYHPPTAEDNAIKVYEDTPYTFVAEDFNFNEFAGDRLSKVSISHAEVNGVLRLHNEEIKSEREISRAELDAGEFEFVPAGAGGDDSFWFKVHDGSAYSEDAYLMTIDVHAAVPVYEFTEVEPSEDDDKDELDSSSADGDTESDSTERPRSILGARNLDTPRVPTRRPAPGLEFVVTTKEDAAYVFTVEDLSPVATRLTKVQIASLELCGLLQLEGMAVTPGQKVSRGEIEAGMLTFIPAAVGRYKYFDFKVHDGTEWLSSKYAMTIEVLPAYDRG